jgi:hypothetical protein
MPQCPVLAQGEYVDAAGVPRYGGRVGGDDPAQRPPSGPDAIAERLVPELMVLTLDEHVEQARAPG